MLQKRVGRPLVLLVEDDPDDARTVLFGLSHEPLRLLHVRTGAEALQCLDEQTPAAIMVDHRLPDGNGVQLIKKIRAAGYSGPLIMVSGVREDRIVARALQAGADDFLVKDLAFGDEVAGRLRRVVEA